VDLLNPQSMAAWSDSAEWSGQGLRRSVFYFASRGNLLYGSMYEAEAPSIGLGLAISPSWGFEVTSQQNLAHALAIRIARLGGAALVFHPPGHGDSQGDPEELSMDALVAATTDAVAEGRARAPAFAWALAGVRLGAAVAALAAGRAGTDLALAIQPAFDPMAFFGQLQLAAHRTALVGGTTTSMVFGHALPQQLIDSANQADLGAALSSLEGTRAVVRFERPSDVCIPDGFEDLVVRGEWSPRGIANGALVERASVWLGEQRIGEMR